MKVNFYLEPTKTNKDGTVPIRMYVRFHNETHRIYLGKTILPQNWDSKKGIAREGNKFPLGSLTNKALNKVKTELEAAELKLELLDIPLTFENLLKQAWPDKLKEKKVNTDPLVSEVIDRLSSIKGGRKEGTMGKYSVLKFAINNFHPDLKASQVKNYAKFLGLSNEQHETKGGIFAERFTQFLQKDQYADSTIFNYLNTLREVYHEIGLDKTTKALDYQSRIADKPSLEAAELRKVIATPMKNAIYQRHKDAFLLQTLLGLRSGDYERLQPIHFDDYDLKGYGQVKVMNLYMRKTTVPVLIPVHPVAEEILKAYDYKVPKSTSKSRILGYQEVCKVAGLDRGVVVTSFVGNAIKTESVPLHELVTTHTARRTCGQLLRKESGQKDVAQYMLGHREKGSTAIYTSEDPERIFPLILKAWDAILKLANVVETGTKKES